MSPVGRVIVAAGLALAVTASAPPVGEGSVRVESNRLVRNGRPFVPRGFSMVGLLSPTQTGTAGTAGRHYGQRELDAAKAWKANTLRFQVSQRGFDPRDSLYSDAYIRRVRDGVALARKNGFVVILSMQDQSYSGGDATPMPEPQTLRSWGELTKYFNHDLEILYELWNEPMVKDSADEWKLWRNGGTWKGQTVIGHQQLLECVRSSGARNVLIAEGTRVGKSFIGCPGLDDPLRQLAYGIHPYLTHPIKNPASWDRTFGDWAKKYPVVCTEWGANSGSPFAQPEWPALSSKLLEYLKAHDIGQIAWSFDIIGTLIRDWDWTPTSFEGYVVGVKGCGPGELVKRHFQQY